LRNAKGLETNYKTRGNIDELKLLKIKHQQVESLKPFELCYLGFWTSTNFLYLKNVKSYNTKWLYFLFKIHESVQDSF
jgi:hypothetical protein